MKHLILSLAFAGSALAQDAALLSEADAILNSEQIDVDGTLASKKVAKTPEEILEDARRANEIRQINKIAKEIAKIQLPRKKMKKITQKESNRLMTRIDNIFNDGEDIVEQDKVVTKQAAPIVIAAPPVIPVERLEIKPFTQIKVLPYFGYQNILGEQIDFSSSLNLGVAVESMLSRRFSAGMGISYSALGITDVANDYDAIYYSGRELNYGHFAVELNSKLFISTDSKIRPYIGVGLSYNRTSLKFEDEVYVTDSSTYQEEKYNSSYIAGHAKLGAEVEFTKNIGMNLEFSYAHGLFKGFDYESSQSTVGQEKLNALGELIENSDFLTVAGGLLVKF